ncbi:hypothetical protein FSG55_012070 [Escherichia coli]|uniref:hypothetical protein n=1 Tax=Escherichia coli TaxID=562 RepID=UPI000251339B|nr:hypothetical protein [Escherichia coli]EFH7906838.1 hypothetical protein [Escherichia coli O157:H7]EEV9196728.1 hypothetical protein [Escherichia coli]EHO3054196.1 hypothetical protein [Escherichia coli]EHW35243.1 hypothetical protein ECDEC9A_3206 [Escherichia coli DEC9A]EIO9258150.1 hypothetical protein [Escherichia coli]
MKQEFLTVATQSADVRPESELNRADRIKAALKAIKAELFNLSEEDLLDLQQAVNAAIQKRNQVAEENRVAESGLKVHQHQQANVPDFNDYF